MMPSFAPLTPAQRRALGTTPERPLRAVVVGFPLETAIAQEAALASIHQQTRYLVDPEGQIHTVHPPESPY